MNLSDLNEAQRMAVECIDAPSLVIAGAGSGKTRVLTYKIAYLLEHDYMPWNILALTFTNKAAREMQKRIAAQVGQEKASGLWMGTFHSIFSRILRIEAQHIGFTSDFTIYDAADSKSLVKSILKELQLDDKTYKPGTVCNRISEAKNHLIFPDQYAMNATIRQRDAQQKMDAMSEIYMTYMKRCRNSNAMDFDDLLLYTYYLFAKHPDILLKYVERFHFVLVDEYQDTNYAQHCIVWQLTQQRQRVCVVGDDAQSIYSFRGANIDNILKFQQTYKGAKLFKLEQNYRSTQNIVNAANSLIANNRGQIHKQSFSEKIEGKKIQLFRVQSDYEESIVVSHRIESLNRRDHIDYKDIAILYRTNAQSRSLEEHLRKLAIPYRIYGGLSFYQRKEVKDVIAYLRLTLNPRDEEAMKRIINYPARGIGDTTVGKVLACASEHGVSPWQIIMDPLGMQLNVNKGTAGKLTDFAEKIMSYHALTETTDAYALARKIVNESGLAAEINKGHEPEDVTRQENLQELMDSIAGFVQSNKEEGKPTSLSEFLQEVSLLTDMDDEGNATDKNKADSDNKVTLMTIHSAKGLEFRVVFVVGLEEELFPNQMALSEGTKGLEEERRLMYVAMTRAEEQLYLSTAQSRFKFGKTELSVPSRFLREIDPCYLAQDASAASSIGAPSPSPRNRFGSSLYGQDSVPVFLREPRQTPNHNNTDAYSRRTDSTSTTRRTDSFSTTRRTDSPVSTRRTDSPVSTPTTGRTLRRISSLPPASTPQPTNGRPNASGLRGIPAASGAQNNTPQGKPLAGTTASGSAATGSSASGSAATGSSAASSPLAVGAKIEHSRFGRGEVTKIEGTGMDTKLTVRFENVGVKILLLRFAQIKVIG